jgi:voltage-gated potassium channel
MSSRSTSADHGSRGIRRRTWEIVEVARPGDGPSWWFDVGIRLLIGLNVAAVVVETVPEVAAVSGSFFRWFEIVSVAVFTAEYIARVWSSVEDPRYRRPVRGRLGFAATPLALVDLLAVLPALLPLVGLDLRILRGVRLFRLFRILKLGRYSRSLRTVGRVFRRRRGQLTIVLTALGFLLLVASSLMYLAEHDAQPERFRSIPAAMWWGVVTLTTLGYGDVYPVTALGRFMAAIFAVSGVLMVALPTAILGAGFMEVADEESDDRRREAGLEADEAGGTETDPRRCPHCGEEL